MPANYYYDLVIVIPVGPNCRTDYVTDTIESIRFYCRCSCKLIIADDSQKDLGKLLQQNFTDTDVVTNEKRHGLAGGLYVSLSKAFKYALDKYDFGLLLRIDTDALVTGENPQIDAHNLFKRQPQTGIAGLHVNETVDYSKDTRIDNKWPASHIIRATGTWRFIKRPVGNLVLRKYFHKATANGYELGENVFGGAYFMSKALLKRLDEAKMLPDYRLKNSRLEEDHLFSLLAKSVGFNLGDLASGDLPFACGYKTLPASPEELNKRGKKIIHSTRAWKDLKEPEIRAYFKAIRNSSHMHHIADI